MEETQGPGRPKHADTPATVTFRLPASMVAAIDSWAAVRGMTRNRAGAELLRLALQPPTGGYNPQTGQFNG